MYLLTSDPILALDVFERTAMKVYILSTPNNVDFNDFERVESVEEFAEKVAADFKTWGMRLSIPKRR